MVVKEELFRFVEIISGCRRPCYQFGKSDPAIHWQKELLRIMSILPKLPAIFCHMGVRSDYLMVKQSWQESIWLHRADYRQ